MSSTSTTSSRHSSSRRIAPLLVRPTTSPTTSRSPSTTSWR
jgi:hypothetical protein